MRRLWFVPPPPKKILGHGPPKGKDLTGTVIVLCKGDPLPDKSQLITWYSAKPQH